MTPRSFDFTVNSFSDFSKLPLYKQYSTDTTTYFSWSSSTLSFHVSYSGEYLFVYRDGDTIDRFPLSIPFDINSKGLIDQQFSTDLYGESTGQLVSWSNDGHHMYLAGQEQDCLLDYHTDTPWDMGSSGSKLFLGGRENFKDSSNISQCIDVFFKPDGTKMFVLNNTDIRQYTLSTAWDMSTASYNGFGKISVNVSTPSGFHFSSDGTKVFIMNYQGFNTSSIIEHTLPSAWTVTTGTTNLTLETEYNIAVNDGGNLDYPDMFCMSNDGYKMYSSDGNTFYQWTLDVAWDLSGGITFNGTEPLGGYTKRGMRFNSDGSQVIVSEGSGDIIKVYSLSSNYDVITEGNMTEELSFSVDTYNYATPTSNGGGLSKFYTRIEYVGGIYVNDDYVFITNRFSGSGTSTKQPNINKFHLRTSDDLTTIDTGSHDTDDAFGGEMSGLYPSIGSIDWSPDGKKFIMYEHSSEDKFYHYTTSLPWNISRTFVTYDGYTQNQSNQLGNNTPGVTIAPDGKSILAFGNVSSNSFAQATLPGYFESNNSSMNVDFKIDSIYDLNWTEYGHEIFSTQISSNGEMVYLGTDGGSMTQLRVMTN